MHLLDNINLPIPAIENDSNGSMRSRTRGKNIGITPHFEYQTKLGLSQKIGDSSQTSHTKTLKMIPH